MLPPDPWDHGSSGGPSSPSREDARPASATPISIDRLAVLLSTSHRQGSPDELARDLQLNDIVEQACLATGATGAAIALARGDEFICRASTGSTAPELGMRLNIDQGLSAYCVHTGEVQRCDDSETDTRVDAEACRHLGVRSVLVVPLVYGEFFLGIFEIFSPQPFAFHDRDIQTVLALSRSVLTALGISKLADSRPLEPTASTEELRHADYEVPQPSRREFRPDPPSETSARGSASFEGETKTRQENVFQTISRQVAQATGARPETPEPTSHARTEDFYPQFKIVQKPPRDYWTGILTALVVALALLLGWMLGHGHMASRNAAREELRAAVAAQQPTSTDPPSTESSEPRQNIDLPSAPSSSSTPMRSPFSSKGAADKPSEDGLVVYQDGKIIYRQRASPRSSRPNDEPHNESVSPVELAPEVAATLLMLRVEPHYPDRARRQNIQGPVVLQALIDEDGSVEQLKVLTGNSDLAVAAIDAVRHWRFKPYSPKGAPGRFATQITVNFALPGAQQVNN